MEAGDATMAATYPLGPPFVGLLGSVLPFLTVQHLGAAPPSLFSHVGFRVFDSRPD
jgi:hypothetical protein